MRGQVLDEAQHALDRGGPDRLHVARLLEDLARHVQRQIVRVDDAAHETEVRRHQLLGVVHDEDAAHVELDPVPMLAIPEVEGRALRDEEELGKLLTAFDLGVGVGQRGSKSCATCFVAFVVLLFGDLDFGRVQSADA
jgi:hypothetical protein